MSFGDQGMQYGPPDPYGTPDPYAQWAAEQERIRRRRLTGLTVGGALGIVLVAAIAVGVVMAVGDAGDSEAAPTTPSTSASTPVTPLSAVRPEQVFPASEKTVHLKDGKGTSTYERVDVATTTDCARGMSPELASLAEQGEGCARLTSALFTDAERRSQVTVTVVSFRRAEDAWLAFGMASTDPVTYQVVSLDPPPRAGLPTVPPGSAGVFRRLATVRSVVFANGQWGDGSETGEAELTEETESLLQYFNDRVVKHEDTGV